MPAFKITLPQEIYRVAHKRASTMGYKTVAEYVAALILVEAGEPIPKELETRAPKSQAIKLPPKR